jgi:pyridoxamine 5'-phosphate oxidase
MIRHLDEEQLESNPWVQFRLWYDDALACNEISYPHAFTLSTLNPQGFPEGRIVLMKGYNENSLSFFTNCLSRKGKSLLVYPRAGINFYWDPLGRQVRMYGAVKKVSDKEADEYFYTRKRESRAGAWASSQSEEIESREVLENNLAFFRESFKEGEIPRPPQWSGYRIIPSVIEFWQFGEFRLHDRFQYSAGTDGNWSMVRLQP